MEELEHYVRKMALSLSQEFSNTTSNKIVGIMPFWLEMWLRSTKMGKLQFGESSIICAVKVPHLV